MSPSHLSVHEANLSFGGIHALKEVGFDVAEGEILAIIGPNGAGKTSLLNAINGFYRLDSGEIIFQDQE
ncbi:MAG: ATP-binding cassette domain-containing protein, partial [Anaerolineales bacterium]